MNGLKKFRRGLGITQAHFAERIGATQQQVSAWEQGDVSMSIKVLFRISDEFNCQIKVLPFTDELEIITL